MKIIITGFNAFGNIKINPSERVVQMVSGLSRSWGFSELKTEVLRTEFEYAGNRIEELIKNEKPDILLLLGVAMGGLEIRLERLADNVNLLSVPDNTKRCINQKEVIVGGPINYLSSLPIFQIKSALERNDIPVRISYDAGKYVCNHVFYKAIDTIDKLELNTFCGFIHIPLVSEYLSENLIKYPSISEAKVLEAIKITLDEINSQVA